MSAHRSISGRLRINFAVIAVVGSISVLTVEFLNFEYLFGAGREARGSRAFLHELVEHVAIPLFLILVPLFVATVWGLRCSFAPLQDAAARIRGASENRRGFRISGGDLPREVIPFVEAVNSLLRRLDEAAARQEAFAADVAHELRTPLAILALELGRLDGAVGAELRQDVQKMTHLVEQLLLLAQVDAETAAPVALVPTDLADLAEELIGRMAPLAHRNDHLIAFERRGRVEAMGRPETIERALRNLIENALAVTPPSECVTVIAGPGPQIRVRDGGPGLSVDDLERLSRRFARADRSTGSGLGLAIVSTIMQHHGGSLATDPEAREIILRFPACSPG